MRADLDLRQAGEWIMRMLLSLVTVPSLTVDLDDPAAVRRFVARPHRPRASRPDHFDQELPMAMKFALFYEIPVPRPWTPESEHQAYKNTIEQAVLGDKVGFHSFWTVEHHFLEEYSHCSNPEVLYGAIAARTENIRLGYGVRLLPKPYNHPIRTAESVAVLDLISDGRVEFGTGRSSTRAELEGFDIDPAETREMWSEALGHIVAAWTEEQYQADGKYWRMGATAPGAAQAAAEAAPADVGCDLAARTATARSVVTDWACARSPSASHPRSWPTGSRSTARAWPSAPSRRASSSTTRPPRSRWCTARRPSRRPTRWPASRAPGT